MKGKVTANRLNVRSAPRTGGGKIGLLLQNNIVEILGNRDRWLEIKYNGGTGFIHKDYVLTIDSPITMKGRVTASSLNVRDMPGPEGHIVGFLSKGSVIDVLEEDGDWLEIGFNEASAFVHGDFVELVESTAPRTGIVSANVLNVRREPGRSGQVVGRLNSGTPVNLVSQIGDWFEIKFNDSVGYIHGDYVDLVGETSNVLESPIVSPADLQEKDSDETPLNPEVILKVVGSSIEKKVARTWNKFGGLLESLSGAIKIEPASAIAVLCVESSGKGFEPKNQNRMIIRFENHLFWRYWGKKNSERFHRHFQYGKRENGKLKSWLGHAWRESTDVAWGKFHGSQPAEWQVLDFARSLDDTAALFSISMGAPQVMGFNHKKIGYTTVQEMFDKFNEDIRYHIGGLFDFFDDKMIDALQRRDFVTFAGSYNGSGQKQKYGEWIQNHYDAFEGIS